MFKRIAVLAIIIVGCICMSGCKTVEGAGKDIEAAGESIQDAAN